MPWWWYFILVLLIALIGLLVFLIWYRRRHPPSLSGISGWLLLPMLILIGNCLVLLGGLLIHIRFFIQMDLGWAREQAATLALVVAETLMTASLLGFTVVLLVFFFQKRRFVPTLFIVYLVTVLAFAILEAAITIGVAVIHNMSPAEAGTEETGSAVGRAIIACAIWIPYFLKSERVKATFVR